MLHGILIVIALELAALVVLMLGAALTLSSIDQSLRKRDRDK